MARNCSLALNHQAGFRLTLYKHRHWDSVLMEPLLKNRLKAETLETMWDVVDAKSAKLVDYFEAKARLLGLSKLNWFDVSAPVGKITKKFSFAEAEILPWPVSRSIAVAFRVKIPRAAPPEVLSRSAAHEPSAHADSSAI